MRLTIPIFQVDAFTDRVFHGNPAAVCLMDAPLADEWLQAIAAENNLAETAYVWNQGDHFHIRWFTPTIEVDLCGHATLASAYVLFFFKNYAHELIRFDSRSGPLYVSKKDDLLILDFPKDILNPVDCPPVVEEALSVPVLDCVKGKSDYLVRIGSEKQLAMLNPRLQLIAQLTARGLIVTAPGDECDFVSRCFFPQSGIDEDPVTGSAHTTLVPYWAAQLNKTSFRARQISSRGGTLYCSLDGDRVKIGGHARLYLQGSIQLDL